MDALNRIGWVECQPVTLPDISATGEADASVDNQNLAMIAQVGVFHQARCSGHQKGGGIQSFAAQPFDHVHLAVA